MCFPFLRSFLLFYPMCLLCIQEYHCFVHLLSSCSTTKPTAQNSQICREICKQWRDTSHCQVRQDLSRVDLTCLLYQQEKDMACMLRYKIAQHIEDQSLTSTLVDQECSSLPQKFREGCSTGFTLQVFELQKENPCMNTKEKWPAHYAAFGVWHRTQPVFCHRPPGPVGIPHTSPVPLRHCRDW